MSRETRDDPYKNFKFAVALVAVGAIAVRIGRKLFARAEFIHPGVHVEEIPTARGRNRAVLIFQLCPPTMPASNLSGLFMGQALLRFFEQKY